MILIDNNILSTFAKVGRLALLFQVTAEVLYISPTSITSFSRGCKLDILCFRQCLI